MVITFGYFETLQEHADQVIQSTTSKREVLMPVQGPVLLYGAGREAVSTRNFLQETSPDLTVHVCVDEGRAEIANTLQVPVSGLFEAFEKNYYATIVRSPGVSVYKPELLAAKAAKINITTNINLWAKYKCANNKIIALTGTKGKSTTAKLLFTMLEAANFDAALAGNIGVPVLELEHHKYVVLELSSFQCADLKLQPDFIGVTSLYPEHLDWHQTEEKYFSDKLNLLHQENFVHQGTNFKCALSAQVLTHYALSEKEKNLDKTLPDLSSNFQAIVKNQVQNSRLVGEHNLRNSELAARLALGIGLSKKAILQGIENFIPLPHRLQEFSFGNKTFVNDSIATNPQATKAAILAYGEKKPHIIIGGFDRDQDYEDLSKFLLEAPLSHIWFLPGTGHRIANMPEGKNLQFSTKKIASLEEIFEHLRANPDQFSTLILSPGAPSYNQFKNFEQRGETFVELARKIFDN